MESKTVQQIIRMVQDRQFNVNVMNDLLDPGIFHCEILGNQKPKGFGSAEDPSLALVKAYAELVERKAFWAVFGGVKNKTSSGFAAHFDPQKAIDSAENELIERDAFLCCWFAQKPPYWLSDEELTHFDEGSLIRKRQALREQGFIADFGIIGVNGSTKVVVGRLTSTDPSKFGFAVDVAASSSILLALQKVYRTLCYFGSVIHKREQNGSSLFDVSLDDIESIPEHFEYFLSPHHRPEWFFSSSDYIFQLEPFEMQTEIVHKCPQTSLFVAQARSNQCQNYFAGKTTCDKVNVKRLKSLFPNQMDFDLTWHPLA